MLCRVKFTTSPSALLPVSEMSVPMTKSPDAGVVRGKVVVSLILAIMQQ